MSNWSDKYNRTSSNVVPISQKKGTNSARVIEPYVCMEDAIRDLPGFLKALDNNDGPALMIVRPHLPKTFRAVHSIAVAHRTDHSVAFFELRIETEPTAIESRTKAYRAFFAADISLSDNPMQDGKAILHSGISGLSKYGLYIPTNSPALLEAQRSAVLKQSEQLMCVWTEGEKTRFAVEDLLAPYLQRFLDKGVNPVCSATLGGPAGVRHTNYALRPPKDTDPRYVVSGKNSEEFDLKQHLHMIVLDNDADGRKEGMILADRLLTNYNVQPSSIFIVEPPKGAPEGWDDADPLPVGMTVDDRIKAFLQPTAYDGWWITTKKGNLIDVDAVENRIRALKAVGVTEAYIDSATEQMHVVGPRPFADKQKPNEEELAQLSFEAIKLMAHVPTARLQLNWEGPLARMAQEAPLRDSIYEETMAQIKEGLPLRTDANKPDMLFINTFNLPDTPYNRAAGWHLIRDYLAVLLRPAYRAEPVIPQLLFCLFGREGFGKSTFTKVLAGASPEGYTPRYCDTVTFQDVQGSSSHQDLQMYLKIKGVTIAELADKSLGAGVGRARADLLKSFANKGELTYRKMHGNSLYRYNIRCCKIFTTNNSDILTEDMGSRRWMILDLEQSAWTTPKELREILQKEKREPTPDEAMLLRGFNPGLNWLYNNRSAVLAHMYESKDYHGTLRPRQENLEMMKEEQEEFKYIESWEVILKEELTKFDKHIGILPSQLALYIQDNFGGRNEAPNSAQYKKVMRNSGWDNPLKRVNGKPTRIWARKDCALQVNTYANWASAQSGFSGRWQAVREIDPDHLDKLEENGSDPF